MRKWRSRELLAGVSVLIQASISAQLAFPGTGVGNIPDGLSPTPGDFGPPLQVSFNVSGLTGPITDLYVAMTILHTYLGDLEVLLFPPSGANPFVLFSRVG